MADLCLSQRKWRNSFIRLEKRNLKAAKLLRKNYLIWELFLIVFVQMIGKVL